MAGARTSRNDAYFNIHTSANPAGEISDFLVRIPPGTSVPVAEPQLIGLFGLAAGSLMLRRRASAQ